MMCVYNHVYQCVSVCNRGDCCYGYQEVQAELEDQNDYNLIRRLRGELDVSYHSNIITMVTCSIMCILYNFTFCCCLCPG